MTFISTGIKRIISGFQFGTRSFELLKVDKGLRNLTAFPVVLTAITMTALLYMSLSYLPGWLVAFLPTLSSPWFELAKWLMWVVGIVGGLVFSFLGTLLLSRIVGLPFYSFMAERTLRILSNEQLQRLTFSRQIRFAANMFFVSLLRTILLLPLLVLLAIGSLIPGIQFAAGALSLIIAAFDFSDYALEAKGYPLSSRFKFFKTNLFEFFGFSLFMGVIFLIPFLNVFLLPLAVIGGSVLVYECSDTNRYTDSASDLRNTNKLLNRI